MLSQAMARARYASFGKGGQQSSDLDVVAPHIARRQKAERLEAERKAEQERRAHEDFERRKNIVEAIVAAAEQPKTANDAISSENEEAPPKLPKIVDIQNAVAKKYNISRVDILSQRRTAEIVRARQIAVYLAKQLTLRSLPEIGRHFGGKDHTTILHSVRKITVLLEWDAELVADIDALKQALLCSKNINNEGS
jgi:chromosomal replication initiation ATPase DnaA